MQGSLQQLQERLATYEAHVAVFLYPLTSSSSYCSPHTGRLKQGAFSSLDLKTPKPSDSAFSRRVLDGYFLKRESLVLGSLIYGNDACEGLMCRAGQHSLNAQGNRGVFWFLGVHGFREVPDARQDQESSCGKHMSWSVERCERVMHAAGES